MATFRNDTGDDLTIDRFGLYVPAGLTFEIPDEDADSLAGQSALVRVATDPDVVLPDEILRDLAPAEDTEPDPEPESAEPVVVPDASPVVPDVSPDVPDATPDVPAEPAEVAPETPAAAPTPLDPFHL